MEPVRTIKLSERNCCYLGTTASRFCAFNTTHFGPWPRTMENVLHALVPARQTVHDFVFGEEYEANHIRHNTRLSYSVLRTIVPPQFPLPFVNERHGLFFTTIMRNPFDRLKTVLRRKHKEQNSLFWHLTASHHVDITMQTIYPFGGWQALQ